MKEANCVAKRICQWKKGRRGEGRKKKKEGEKMENCLGSPPECPKGRNRGNPKGVAGISSGRKGVRGETGIRAKKTGSQIDSEVEKGECRQTKGQWGSRHLRQGIKAGGETTPE